MKNRIQKESMYLCKVNTISLVTFAQVIFLGIIIIIGEQITNIEYINEVQLLLLLLRAT